MTSKENSIATQTSLLVHENEIQPTDVLCGRGRRCFQHDGNVNYRDMVAKYSEVYQKTNSRTEKSRIVNAIVDSLGRNGSRFLKQHEEDGNDHWRVLSTKEARLKIAHTFRDYLSDRIKSMKPISQSDAAVNENDLILPNQQDDEIVQMVITIPRRDDIFK
jgi:hypothetical protein